MLVANVWHWWIGIALLLVSLIFVVLLVVSYMKFVSSQKYPSAKQQRARHSDL